jgi:hypothetical protein
MLRPSRSPEPTHAELRAKVARLKADFERWSSKCYMILDKARNLVPLRLNPVQLAIYQAERQEMAAKGRVRQIILKGRQGGVTTYEQARSLHVIWSVRGATALTLASDRDLTDKIFKITKRALDNFPGALLPPVGERIVREISFPTRDSSFYTGTAGANRAGAGLTLYRFHGSEFAHWDSVGAVLKAVGPSLEAPGTTAALETTGGGYESDAHNFWKEAVSGKNGYTALFFPWWECDPHTYRTPLLARDELGTLADDEKDLVKTKGLSLEQIKWRRKKIEEMGRQDFLQEYAEDTETCWLAAGGMFYDAEVLKALKLRAPRPLFTERSGALEWFMRPEKVKGRVVIGADTAEGGGDRFTASARQFEGWKNVAKFESSATEPKEFAGILNDLGRKLGTALLVVEKNLHGITVLRHLRDDHKYPLDRIYHRAPLDRPDAQPSERIGWATTAESYPIMLDAGRELLNAAKDGHAEVPTASAITDYFGVRRDKTGRIKLTGKDVLVAEMLAWIGRSYNIARPRVTVVSV